jgi:hypothetical protein
MSLDDQSLPAMWSDTTTRAFTSIVVYAQEQGFFPQPTELSGENVETW